MPGCGEPQELPEKVDPEYHGPFDDKPSEDTNPPFVRDLSVPELEEIIEKCVRRVLQGEDLKREWERIQATRKK